MNDDNADFSLPRDGPEYTESIFLRARNLISTGIWADFEVSRLDGWISNFKDPLSKYFAACVLDSFIYRSSHQTTALMDDVFDRNVRQLCVEDRFKPFDMNLRDYFSKELQHDDTLDLIIVPVINNSDPPTKSGPLITRLLKRNLGLNEDLMTWPWNIERYMEDEGTKGVLFVDDMLGSGDQFEEFIECFDLAPIFDNIACVYAPLLAHVKGIEKLSKKYNQLGLAPVEILKESSNIFDSKFSVFNDGINNVAKAKKYYAALLKKISFPYGKARRGYSDLGLTVSFQHAIPDNSLPILWWHSADNWKPLLDR